MGQLVGAEVTGIDDAMTSPDVGEIRKEFRPGLDNLVAGWIIGALLVGGGCAAVFFPLRAVIQSGGKLPFSTDRGWCWVAVGMAWILAVALVVSGVFLILWLRSLASLRVGVGANGLAITGRNRNERILWSDLDSVRETRLYERPPILKGPAKLVLPKIMSKSFVLQPKAGKPFGFDGTSIKGHLDLAALIEEEATRRGIAWEVVEEHAS